MKRIYFFLLLFIPAIALSQSFRTVTLTGNTTDFTNKESYNSSELPTITYSVAYDETNLYLSVVNTAGNFGTSDSFNIFIDTDPDGDSTGSNVGTNFANVTPTLPFNANYAIRLEENYNERREWNGTDWNTITQFFTAQTGSNHRQFVLAKADIGNPEMIRFTMWMGYNGGTFAEVPADRSPNNDNNPVFTEYFGSVDINRAGSNPSKVTNTNATYATYSSGTIPAGTYSRLEVTGFPTTTGPIVIAPGGTLAITGISISNFGSNDLTFGNWAGISVDVNAPTTINTSGKLLFENGGISRTNNATSGASLTINPNVEVTGDFYANRPLITSSIKFSGNGFNKLPLRFLANSVLIYNSNAMTTTGPEWGTDSIVSLPGTPDHVVIDQPVLALNSDKFLSGYLKIDSGNLNLNGYDLKLRSNTSRSAVIGPLGPTASITGNTVVSNKLIPARNDGNRAFRFLASPVNGQTIYESLQSNGSTFLAQGTQITGGDASLGFDQSGSNNPSMFKYLNNPVTGSPRWEAVANTNATNFEIGLPLRTFIRGDRSRDLFSNTQAANNTTLSATGSVVTGDVTYDSSSTVNKLNDAANAFNMIANPYAAYVDMSQVLAQSTDVNPNFYYVWDPTVNSRGAYVTVTLSSDPVMNGENNVTGSDADQFMEPWQSSFVQNNSTVTTGASVFFTENTKTLETTRTNVFHHPNNIDRLNLTLKDNSGNVIDGTRVDFDAAYADSIDSMDAIKLSNLDESLSFTTAGAQYSLLRNAMPSNGMLLPVHLTTYRQTNYSFDFIKNGLALYHIKLIDNYLNIEHDTNLGSYAFTVDASIPVSMSADRFMIMFDNTTLGVDDTAFAKAISIYPNPVLNENWNVYNPLGETFEIAIYNMLGQEIASRITSSEIEIDMPKLNSGSYLVSISNGKESITKKLLVK
ncbi:MAG: T9SS type A sorting domain-containing protein [Nonlabens sp.]|uniref:T9SS type A sorting domain-containing protein n=1 Tax=Nonlabens sp. TaxID=1888209 RepID=UPI003EF7A191